MSTGWAARRGLLAFVLLALAAGAAGAARDVEQRVRRLHLPPAVLTAPAPPPSQPGSPPASPAPSPPGAPPPPAPPPPPPPLPTSVAVGEDEFVIDLSRTLVGSGQVTFNIYNRGEDDHDLALRDAAGILRTIDVPAGQGASLVATLNFGTTKLYCSLFAGTPGSHEALGMVAYIEVG